MITKVKNVLILFLCSFLIGLFFSCKMNEASNDDGTKTPKKGNTINVTLKVTYESNYTKDYKLTNLLHGCNIYDAVAAYDEEFDEYLKNLQTGSIEAEKIDEGIRRVTSIAPYENYTIKKANDDNLDFDNDVFEGDTVIKISVTKKSDIVIEWGWLKIGSQNPVVGAVCLENETGPSGPANDIYPAFGFITSDGKIIWSNISACDYANYNGNNNDYWSYQTNGLAAGTYKVVFLANGYLCSKTEANGGNTICVPDISFFFSDNLKEDYYETLIIS